MLNQKDIQAFESLEIRTSFDLDLQIFAKNHANIIGGEYIPLADRLREFIIEPDKAAGFTFVGNDTWFPKHLVNDRRHQHRKISRGKDQL